MVHGAQQNTQARGDHSQRGFPDRRLVIWVRDSSLNERQILTMFPSFVIPYRFLALLSSNGARQSVLSLNGETQSLRSVMASLDL
jgi:hypothetical protein